MVFVYAFLVNSFFLPLSLRSVTLPDPSISIATYLNPTTRGTQIAAHIQTLRCPKFFLPRPKSQTPVSPLNPTGPCIHHHPIPTFPPGAPSRPTAAAAWSLPTSAHCRVARGREIHHPCGLPFRHRWQLLSAPNRGRINPPFEPRLLDWRS